MREGGEVREFGSWMTPEANVKNRIKRVNGLWWKVRGWLKESTTRELVRGRRLGRNQRKCSECGVCVYRRNLARNVKGCMDRRRELLRTLGTIRERVGERIEDQRGRRLGGGWPSASCVEGHCPTPKWQGSRGVAECGNLEVDQDPEGARMVQKERSNLGILM